MILIMVFQPRIWQLEPQSDVREALSDGDRLLAVHPEHSIRFTPPKLGLHIFQGYRAFPHHRGHTSQVIGRIDRRLLC